MREVAVAPVRRVGDFTEVEARDTGFRFLSQAEIFWALTLESPDSKDNSDGRRKRQKSSVLNGIPLNTSGLMILLALEGVPVQSLVRLHHFYQLGNFLLDQASGNIYFLVLVENNKVGGLSAVPVFVCHGSEKEHNRLWCLLRHLFPNGNPSDRLFPSYRIKSTSVKKKASQSLENQLGFSLAGMMRQKSYRSTLERSDYC